MGRREGQRRVRVICVCVYNCAATYQKQFQLVSIARHQPQPLAIALLCSHFPLLSLSLLGFPLLLLQWATLFSSPHTRHKSMFDFHNNNSRREIRKAMRKKTTKRETARRSRQGHGTRDTGDRTQDIMFAPCLKFLPLVCVIFILYTFFLRFPALLFISCVTHFFVVSLRQMKCIKFRDMRGATQRQIEGGNNTLRVCGQRGR